MTRPLQDRWADVYRTYAARFGTCRSDPAKDRFAGDDKKRPWWPMRFFQDDDVLAVWAYRVWQRNRCQVALFLAADHYRYQAGSAATGGVVCLLTQTFHQLGTMAVEFVGPGPRPARLAAFERAAAADAEATDGRRRGNPAAPEVFDRREAELGRGFEPDIPPPVREVADRYGVRFRAADRIADDEGRRLFARITGFSDATIARFADRGIDLTRACFLVQRDIWAFDQVEFLLAHAPAPRRLFEGGLSPLARLPHQRDLLVLRTALLEERVRTRRERLTADGAPNPLATAWVGGARVRYTPARDVGPDPFAAKAGAPFEVVLAPRTAQGYAAFAPDDFRAAADGVLAVTRDFAWAGVAPPAGLRLVPVFDTVAELDAEIASRLNQAVTTRTPPSERHE